MGMVVITIYSFSKGKHNQICHEDTKARRKSKPAIKTLILKVFFEPWWQN